MIILVKIFQASQIACMLLQSPTVWGTSWTDLQTRTAIEAGAYNNTPETPLYFDVGYNALTNPPVNSWTSLARTILQFDINRDYVPLNAVVSSATIQFAVGSATSAGTQILQVVPLNTTPVPTNIHDTAIANDFDMSTVLATVPYEHMNSVFNLDISKIDVTGTKVIVGLVESLDFGVTAPSKAGIYSLASYNVVLTINYIVPTTVGHGQVIFFNDL